MGETEYTPNLMPVWAAVIAIPLTVMSPGVAFAHTDAAVGWQVTTSDSINTGIYKNVTVESLKEHIFDLQKGNAVDIELAKVGNAVDIEFA